MVEITIVGDITIDNFITLSDEYVHKECKISDTDCELTMPFGGKIPLKDIEVHCGGNAANVAIGLHRLGIKILPIIPLGKDVFSTIALGVLGKEGIDLHNSLINDKNKCNSSYIFRYEGDRTIFSHHESKEYPFEKDIDTPYLYFSSHSGENNSLSTQVIANIQKNKSKLIFAPSNTQIHGDKSILEGLIAHSYLLICNKEEAYEMLSKVDEAEINTNYMLHRFHHFGAHHVVITDGANGVYLLNGDTEETLHLKSDLETDKVVDATGAGDAMCTGVTYGLIKGLQLKDGVELGLRNSASVLQMMGAQSGLLYKEDIKK